MAVRTLCMIFATLMACSACSNKNIEQRIDSLEQKSLQQDVACNILASRVQTTEQMLTKLAHQRYEVQTKDGKKTKYVITPMANAAQPLLPTPQPVQPANALVAPNTAAATPVAPVSPQAVVAPVVTPQPVAPAVVTGNETTLASAAPVRSASGKPAVRLPLTPSPDVPMPPGDPNIQAQTAQTATPAVIQPVAPVANGTSPVIIPPSPNRNLQPNAPLPTDLTHAQAVPVVTAPTPQSVIPQGPAQIPPAQTASVVAQQPVNAAPSLALPPADAPQNNAQAHPVPPVVVAHTPATPALALPPEGNVPAVATQPAPSPARAAAPAPAGAQRTYQSALQQIMAGQYAQGRANMEAFTQQYPQSGLVANAYYWIGESYYAQNNFPDALMQFKQVSTQFPKHDKTPDALLKAGMTYQRMGDAQNADMQFKALLADFPRSNAANIARSRGWGR